MSKRVSLARKNLLQDKVRLLISAGGVAFSTALILLLIGLYQGVNNLLGRYIEHVSADIWVAQPGASDFTGSASFVQLSAADEIRSVPGVVDVTPYYGRRSSLDVRGKAVASFLAGFDEQHMAGGPIKVIEGRKVAGSGQIIVDKVFAKNNDLVLEDTIDVLGNPYKVVGISSGGNVFLLQYSFISHKAAQELLAPPGHANFFLVKTTQQSDQTVVSAINQKVPGVQALLSEVVIKNNKDLVQKSFLPIIFILVVIGFFIGSAVVAITIYSATIERSREYGIVKALGAPAGFLYRVVFQQALISGAIGYGLGVGLTYGISAMVVRFIPQFVTDISLLDMAGTAFAVGLMCLLASYLPISRINRIDPAVVFKAS
jgi:putative ABC transport system permease protein